MPVAPRLRERPRPNRLPRRSPTSSAPTSNENPPAPGRPGPPGPKPPATGPRRRTSSYSLRRASSPSTSYAAEISLKRSSALGSSRLASGWYSRASFRYALVMSLADAPSSTPNTE
jgi:hypothetical protein